MKKLQVKQAQRVILGISVPHRGESPKISRSIFSVSTYVSRIRSRKNQHLTSGVMSVYVVKCQAMSGFQHSSSPTAQEAANFPWNTTGIYTLFIQSIANNESLIISEGPEGKNHGYSVRTQVNRSPVSPGRFTN